MDDERLHPEGAPGTLPNMLRGLLGDTAYENQQAANTLATAAALKRHQAITGLIVITSLLALIWGIGGFILTIIAINS